MGWRNVSGGPDPDTSGMPVMAVRSYPGEHPASSVEAVWTS